MSSAAHTLTQASSVRQFPACEGLADMGPTSLVHHRDRHLMKCLTSGFSNLCWVPSGCSLHLHLSFPPILSGQVLLPACQCGKRIYVAKHCKADSSKRGGRRVSFMEQRDKGAVLPWQVTTTRCCGCWGGTLWTEVPHNRAPSAASRANELPRQTNGVLIGHYERGKGEGLSTVGLLLVEWSSKMLCSLKQKIRIYCRYFTA